MSAPNPNLSGLCGRCSQFHDPRWSECPEPSPVVRRQTDEEYMDSYAIWEEHQEMHRR